jgi:transcriptional regulator with XRE-family HTH domain
MSTDFRVKLGAGLRAERKKAGLTQTAVGLALGLKPPGGHGYVSCLEAGKMGNVGIETVVRYLQICKTPVGKFMLELAQSGAFGEAEQGLIVVEDREAQQQKRREKAKARYEQRAAREARDADIVAVLWREVQIAIAPLLPPGQPHYYSAYLNGVRAFYRAWRLARREARGMDPTPLVQSAFDRVERAGIELRLVPAAVRKMREIVFDSLMAMTPQGGNS